MKLLLRSEELAQFLCCLLLLVLKGVAWWWYLLLLLGPDISMLGYLINARSGAVCYNLAHHKGVALLVLFAAFIVEVGDMLGKTDTSLWPVGLVLFGHSSLDRMLGYGLKFGDHFQHTHLGWIGKARQQGQ